MSLNGLDSPAVQDAYQHATAESGGWFLLKYVNRDSVELYERGKSGVNEARVAVAKYEEQSPLYGLIIYRRRKVLIKYVPEGTSRLLQARTTVHFQDVLEKYSPYETLLEIKTAEGLSDTALAAVFPLHTASPAISSNRLNEISEDAEDGAPASTPPTTQAPSSLKSNRERRADRALRSERQRTPRRPSNSPPPSIQVNGEASPVSSLASPKSTISQFLVREEAGHRSISSLTTPSVASATEYAGSERSDTNTEPESAPPSKPDLVQPASQSTTIAPPSEMRSSAVRQLPQNPSSTEEQTLHVAEEVAPPSVREQPAVVPETRRPTGLQERPVPASDERTTAQRLRERNDDAARPSTEKPHDDDPYDLKKYDYLFKPKTKLGPRLVPQDNKKARPSVPSVAAVPSNIKPQPPRKDTTIRPKSQGPATIPASQLPVMPAPPPIPDIPEYNPRPLSRGSVKSLPSHKSTAMTPDKLRLMKAIELRKKQMRKSQGAAMVGKPKFDADAPDVPKVPEQPQQQEPAREPEQVLSALREPEQSPSKKADSGIEMDYHNTDKQEDKKTLELLESPRKEDNVAGEKYEHLEDPGSPTPIAEESHEPTPKAEPVVPLTTQEGIQGGMEERVADDPEDHVEGDEDVRTPQRLATASTPIASATANTAEPSLDERQVFGDDPNGRYTEEKKALEPPLKSARRQKSDLAKRRRGYIEPLQLEDMSSDDEFVEELRTATVQQAKPMTVAKSPITESFIRRPSYSSVLSEASDARTESALQRTVSGERLQDHNVGGFSPSSRETSPTAERIDPMTGMKRNVSSGISRRIQALADMSSRDPSPSGYNPPSRSLSPEMSPGNLLPRDRGAQSKSSLRPSRSRTGSFQKAARLSARMSASQQHQPLDGSSYQHENAPVLNVHRDPTTNRDSVSVTARIVRPKTDDKTPPAEELQQSSYMFNNNRPVPTETMAQLTRLDTSTPALPSRSESAASISPEAKPMSPDQHSRTMHSSKRNHYGRHKQATAAPGAPLSPHPDDFPVPPASATSGAQSSTSLASVNDEAAGSKEGTRTSRFFKRMSHIATKRRSAAQASIASESGNSASDHASVRAKGKPAAPSSRDGERSADTPPAVVVGSLNVQFPDSLLWKRRLVTISDDGHLCFAVPQAMEHQRGVAKRFPLADFRAPYVPDLDRQELPFSVMLDFADGSGMTLQAACEDGVALRQVVGVLRGYWKVWAGA